MAGRRIHLARVMMALGMRERVAPDGASTLIVFNFHRIWPSASNPQTEFDRGVFDTDIDTFRQQMRWLKATTVVLDEQGLLALAAAPPTSRGTRYSAVTFDDGYIDCYALAKPVLDELSIRAIFFIPCGMIDSRKLGWWDIAAYLLKKSPLPRVQLRGEQLELGVALQHSTSRMLSIFKSEPYSKTAALLKELSNACEVDLPSREVQGSQLMDWPQIKSLREDGHSIGSHTLSHRVLSTLDESSQAREISQSKTLLESRVGDTIRSFAYPVGGPQHFNSRSVQLVEEAGYSQAFSFNTGNSRLPLPNRFLIPRESAKSLDWLKAKVRFPGFMGLQSQAHLGVRMPAAEV